MRVAFVFVGAPGNGWLGGRNYFENLFRAIGSLSEAKIEVIAFAGQGNTPVPRRLKSPPILTSLVKPRSIPWLARYTIRTLSSRDWVFESYLRKHNVEVLSHAQHLGSKSKIATVGWIPDFQHLHLPEFFTKDQITARNRYYRHLCAQCDRVIVSSECARKDLASFLPMYAEKARTLQFVSAPESSGSPQELADLRARYSFDQPFLLLPNQFWAHKNHKVVISALNILKRRGRAILTLATGHTDDSRNPTFFESLMNYAKDCDVLSHFRVLGAIPSDDLTSLMHHSVGIINPSKFEGWSTSVEESKSLGKRIVVSDIPVHREQAPTLGIYFNPDDAEELAAKLLECYTSFQPDVDRNNQRQALLQLPGRQKIFANVYQDLVYEAAATKK